MSLKHF